MLTATTYLLSPEGNERMNLLLTACLCSLVIPVGSLGVAAGTCTYLPSGHNDPPPPPNASDACMAACWVPHAGRSMLQMSHNASRCSSSFRRFSHSAARELLRNRHVLFVGDSLLRYQMTALAYFLLTGDNLSQWDDAVHGHPTILSEVPWGVKPPLSLSQKAAWERYFAALPKIFRGTLLCDCYRDVCHPNCSPQSFVTNLHFRLASHGIRVTFVFSAGSKIPPRWHPIDESAWVLPCADTLLGPAGCSGAAGLERDLDNRSIVGVLKAGKRHHKRHRHSKQGYAPNNVNILGEAPTDVDVLRAVEARFAPNVTVVGLHNFWPTTAQPSLCELARKFDRGLYVDLEPGQGPEPLRLWRSNSVARNMYNVTQCKGGPYGPHSRLLDNAALTLALVKLQQASKGALESVFIDHLHFVPWVYGELNQYLLNVLSGCVHATKPGG